METLSKDVHDETFNALAMSYREFYSISKSFRFNDIWPRPNGCAVGCLFASASENWLGLASC